MKKILVIILASIAAFVGTNVYADQAPFTDAQMKQLKVCVGMSKIGAILFQGRFIEGRSESDTLTQIAGFKGSSKNDLIAKSMMKEIVQDVYQVPVPTSDLQMKAEYHSVTDRAFGRCVEYFRNHPLTK